jgi:exopolysaccharide/PEP-CTERM locus tyrosine autokinase
MTEHTRIPVPDHDDADGAARPSLIERVVRNYDLTRLSPPPMPEVEAARPVRRSKRYRMANEPETEAATGAEAPEVVHPEVIAPIPHAVASPSAHKPMRFTGRRHPIDREHLRVQGMIVPEGTVSALLEEFRIVKRQLMANAAELTAKCMGLAAQRILICSPLPGEGKTYTAVNLALAIAAEKECEVLLVDADFAKPSVLSTLGLPRGPGLMDALSDQAIDVADCVLGTDIGGLWVLPAGDATTSDSEFLASARCREVLDSLIAGAPNRMVIFDSPPALAASPAAELAKHVGQAVLVARADRTGQSALEDAVSLLAGCPNIRLLLNGVHFSPSGRRFGAYYGYGE